MNSHKDPDSLQIKDFQETTKPILTIEKNRIIIPNEDHTIMNPLRYIIQRNCADVSIVGYSIPHPAEKKAELKMQFKREKSIRDVTINGLKDLIRIGEVIITKLDEEGAKFQNRL